MIEATETPNLIEQKDAAPCFQVKRLVMRGLPMNVNIEKSCDDCLYDKTPHYTHPCDRCEDFSRLIKSTDREDVYPLVYCENCGDATKPCKCALLRANKLLLAACRRVVAVQGFNNICIEVRQCQEAVEYTEKTL